MKKEINNQTINKLVEIAVNKSIETIKEELAKYEPEYSYKTFEPDREAMRKHFREFLKAEFPN